MDNMKARINKDDDNLYCTYSKEQIEIGESYVEVIEDYLGDKIIKPYKKEYLDVLVEDDIWLGEEELGEGNFYEAEGFDENDK